MSPVIATSGTESSAAVATPVTAFIMPGPTCSEQHAGLAGGPGVAVGGVRGGLLVPGDDELDGAAAERVQQRDVGVPAGAEDVLDAVRLKLVDERAARRSAVASSFSPQIDMPRSSSVLTTV